MSHTGFVDEHMRLQALDRYRILDTAPEARYDDAVTLAAAICDTPIAMISLIDERRQWLKAKVGVELDELPRELAFCNVTIQKRELFIVPDARRDPCFAHSPLVTQRPCIVFYAGAPLITRDGYAIGTLNVMDRVPRVLTEQQLQALCVLAQQVADQLELRKSLAELERTIAQRDATQAQLQRANRLLEERVAQRTAELQRANASLQAEADRRGRGAGRWPR